MNSEVSARFLQMMASLGPPSVPAPRIVMADDFREDSRSRYQTAGEVGWGGSGLGLSAGVSLSRSFQAGPSVAWTVELDALAPGDAGEIKIVLMLCAGPLSALVAITYRDRDGRMVVSARLDGVLVREEDGPRAFTSRTFPAAEGGLGGTWTLRLHYGQVELEHDGQPCGSGFIGSGSHPVQQLAVLQVSGQATLHSLRLDDRAPGLPLNPEQQGVVHDAERLNGQVVELWKSARAAEALPLAGRALESFLDVFGPFHRESARALMNVAAQYQQLGRADDALPLYEAAIDAARAVFGPRHFELASMVDQVGSLYRSQGDLMSARMCFEQAADVFVTVLGAGDPLTLNLLHELEPLLEPSRDYAALRRLLEVKILGLSEVLGDDIEIARLHNELAVLLGRRGDIGAARPHYEAAVRLCKKTVGENDVRTAKSMNNLAFFLMSIGEHAAAQPLLEAAWNAIQAFDPRDDAFAAGLLNNLGVIHTVRGDATTGRAYLRKALDLSCKALGPEHPLSIRMLVTLAGADHHAGDSDALPRLLNTLSRFKTAPVSELFFATLHISDATMEKGRVAEALHYLKVAEDLVKEGLGSHPDLATLLYGKIGSGLERSGDLEGARRCYEVAMRCCLRHVRESLTSLSEAEALGYIGRVASARNSLLGVLGRIPDVGADEAYPFVWQTRGMVRRVLTELQWGRGSRAEVAHLWDELRDIRRQLAELTLSPGAPDKAAARQQRMAELTWRKEQCQRSLSAAAVSFGARRAGDADHLALLAKLPTDTAVVDLIEVGSNAEGGETKAGARTYEAFVLRRPGPEGGESVNWVRLGDAGVVDALIERWRQEIARGRGTPEPADPGEGGEESPHTRLRRLVWEPVERQLAGCKTVIVVPDGALVRLPWMALPGRASNTYLIEEYVIGTVSDGQQLHALLSEPPVPAGPLLVVVGVAYDPDTPPVPVIAAASPARGPAIREGGRPRWPALPGTEAEARAVLAAWGAARPSVFLGAGSATEDALRALLPGSRYVHLATHGFFADAAFRSALRHDVAHERLFDGPLGAGRRETVTGRNPLILSGVVLAGANRPARTDEWGAPVGADGIVTAEELADLDLTRTELVVLSACETGLGEVAGGEGVFGLQRALGMGGARAVIGSLWKVDDQAACALMTEFYRTLWNGEMSPQKLESLRLAQQVMIRRYEINSGRLRDLIGEPPDNDQQSRLLPPLYWAAFVLDGDWR